MAETALHDGNSTHCTQVGLLAEQPSVRLLKHIVRCYLRLSDNPRAREALRQVRPWRRLVWGCTVRALQRLATSASCIEQNPCSTLAFREGVPSAERVHESACIALAVRENASPEPCICG